MAVIDLGGSAVHSHLFMYCITINVLLDLMLKAFMMQQGHQMSFW